MTAIVRSPNRWSCLPAAFAMAMNTELSTLIDLIGHDGSDIINDYPEPYCRRSFHIQEILPAVLTLGYNCTIIESKPTFVIPYGDSQPEVLNINHIPEIMDKYPGIICGMWTKRSHAAYHKNGIIYDPNGYSYPLGFRHIDIECYMIIR